MTLGVWFSLCCLEAFFSNITWKHTPDNNLKVANDPRWEGLWKDSVPQSSQCLYARL